jgi:hypothetical protein
VVDVIGANPVVMLWAHPRSISTAVVRMMMERADVTVVHEPLVILTDHGSVEIPGRTARSVREVLDGLRELGKHGPVFAKDTLEFPYPPLFEDPSLLDGIEHTFIVRDPAATIRSHAAIKPEVARHEIGFEHQYELFELVKRHTGRVPTVVDADALLADPAGVVRAYCDAIGWEFRPETLHWRPGDRPEFRINRKWHLDTIGSSGFTPPSKEFARTVENDELLASYLTYHTPFYRQLVKHAIAPVEMT